MLTSNVIVIRIIFVLTLCSTVQCRRVKRVVGGMEVQCDTQPRVASLRNSTTLGHICGATVLSPDFALTAAHCVEHPASQYSLQLNNCCADPPPRTKVIEIIIHHLYDSLTRAHDIAVLRIQLNLGDITTGWQGVALPNASFGVSGECKIYGYGSREFNTEQTSDVLVAADVTIVSLDYCTQVLGPIAPDCGSGMMCALGDGTDACQGDSGSPLVCDSLIEGISSYGLSCAVDGVPGVYTSIGAHLRWIQTVMGT